MSVSIWRRIADYLSLVKFAHTVFALPFAIIGFFLAMQVDGQEFSWRIFFLMLCAMVFARNSAMSFNRYVDRFIDSVNPRTAGRELPSKKLSSSSVLIFVFVNVALFVLTTALINRLTLILSIPALIIIMGYSFLKRYTFLCHYGLGLSLAIAPIGAYISMTGSFNIVPLILSAIVFLWSSGFDILYSLDDEQFDKKYAIHSIPARFGRKRAMIISAVGHALVLPLLLLFYYYGMMGTKYIIGAVVFTLLLIYQHLIIKPTDISRLNAAFFTSNGIASLLFAIFTVWDILA
ncbi:MAG: UbiA-like polyprenyltransferase [Rikenellaceae bacterium]|jgi:4-hydroxybenzoate polyprenyltransferase|nr:putative 4-hydroxybenzoate polyprenyltransferase [Bacteroidales bacterium]